MVARLLTSLSEYFPAALSIVDNLGDRYALAVLAEAPTPAEASALALGRIGPPCVPVAVNAT